MRRLMAIGLVCMAMLMPFAGVAQAASVPVQMTDAEMSQVEGERACRAHIGIIMDWVPVTLPGAMIMRAIVNEPIHRLRLPATPVLIPRPRLLPKFSGAV